MASTKKAAATPIDLSIYTQVEARPDVTFTIAVTGSSTWTNQDMINTVLDKKMKTQLAKTDANIRMITFGQAKGADKMVAEWAAKHDSVNVQTRPANFDRNGKTAIANRNWSVAQTEGIKAIVAFDTNPGEGFMIADLHRVAVKNSIKFEAYTQ